MAKSVKYEATPVAIPIVHATNEKLQKATANVSILEPAKGEPYLLMTVSIPFHMNEIGKLTGAQRIGPMAQWLQEQALPLEEMLADGAARDVMLEYLAEYARQDRESGRLPNPRKSSKRSR
jgi:hypothetical protein